MPWAADRSVAVWKGERAAKSLSTLAIHRPRGGQAGAAVVVPDGARDGLDRRCGRRCSPSADLTVVLHEEASAPLASVDRARLRPRSVVVVVGPEGGLTDDEVAAFTAAGAQSVRLGAEVLRTSTAGVAAVSALLSQTPRWR